MDRHFFLVSIAKTFFYLCWCFPINSWFSICHLNLLFNYVPRLGGGFRNKEFFISRREKSLYVLCFFFGTLPPRVGCLPTPSNSLKPESIITFLLFTRSYWTYAQIDRQTTILLQKLQRARSIFVLFIVDDLVFSSTSGIQEN